MIFWCGSADPCLWLVDPDSDPDPAIFRHWPSRRQQKLQKKFLLITFEEIFTSFFSKIKSQNEFTNSRNQGLTYFSFLDDRRIRIRIRTSALTNGSGSGRPKKMQIRIRNTAVLYSWLRETRLYVEQCRLTLVTIVLLKMPQPMEVDIPFFYVPPRWPGRSQLRLRSGRSRGSWRPLRRRPGQVGLLFYVTDGNIMYFPDAARFLIMCRWLQLAQLAKGKKSRP